MKDPVKRLMRHLEAAQEACRILEQERNSLRAKLDDALETLKPFEAVAQPGYSADSTRLRTVTVREGDLCQAWQVLRIGRRWRPEK